MKQAGIVAAVVVLAVGAHFVDHAKAVDHERCVYVVETPSRNDGYYSLQDARNAMVVLGVDPDNTPVGYDITSRKGC